MKFSWSNRPTVENRIHIDLYEVFRKELVKGTIFKNKYRTLKLQDVSQGVLGKGKYGSGAISGANISTLPIEQQEQYVLQDAQLEMDLSKANKGQIISLMHAISEFLKIRVKLAKKPADYAVNNPNKKIGTLLGAKAGDVIWYYKIDEGVSINSTEISIKKYEEMLMAIVKDALEILGYDAGRIFNDNIGIRRG